MKNVNFTKERNHGRDCWLMEIDGGEWPLGPFDSPVECGEVFDFLYRLVGKMERFSNAIEISISVENYGETIELYNGAVSFKFSANKMIFADDKASVMEALDAHLNACKNEHANICGLSNGVGSTMPVFKAR